MTLENTVPLRPPHQVMRLARMGCFHQSRLSFMRSLLRRLKKEQWAFSRPVWNIDKKGVGVAVYTATGTSRTYSLICFSHDLDPSKRSDRSIATEWDATFTAFDGIPNHNDIQRLAQQVPQQEAGRLSDKELTLSRANRSVRLFSYVVDTLAEGKQPEQEKLDATGYLMRTTAVYGSGKFGAASRDKISDRPELSPPFQIEMLTVFLIRSFTLDIVEHLAHAKAPHTATTMKPHLRRRLGVGNSTGLGMAPFLVNHPILLHKWIYPRETALARVRSLHTHQQRDHFHSLLAIACKDCHLWHTSDARQDQRIKILTQDLKDFSDHLNSCSSEDLHLWNNLYLWAQDNLSTEAQELIVSLLIEAHADTVDDLADTMSADERAHFPIKGNIPLSTLQQSINSHYQWALNLTFHSPECQEKYWYVSENKLEPRVGSRHILEPIGNLEMPVAIGQDIIALNKAIALAPPQQKIADFLLENPQHRHTVRRIQITQEFPYSEIHDNLLHADTLPLDMLRCKLSFFGATHFDPKSDRWTRITMFQHAPFPEELQTHDADLWVYPSESRAS